MKKVLALALAAVMVMALCGVAFAANHTISIPETTTHTYEIFQIFKGEYDSSTEQLQNMLYGANSNGTADTPVSQADMERLVEFATKTYANDPAKIADLESLVNFGSTPVATIGDDDSASGFTASLPEGYYVIIDKAGTVADPDTYTLYMFKLLTADLAISAKDGTITHDKQVQENSTGNYGDAADYNIGDDVPYKLIVTLPANYANYKEYYLKFFDDMSKGLTLNADSVKIHYGESDTEGTAATLTASTTITSSYTDGTVYTLEISDLKAVVAASSLTGGDKVWLTYTAKLNSNAAITSTGNPNAFKVEYSNNPNHEGDGTPTNTTPPDITVVFTYKTIVNKVDPTNTALPGADFDLYKLTAGTGAANDTDNVWTLITNIHTGTGAVNPSKTDNGTGSDDATTFTFSGLDQGMYKLVETTVPLGYNGIDDIYFTVTATYGTSGSSTVPVLLTLNGVDSTNTITLTPTIANASLETDIENHSGITLPTTGGIGTTIFYVSGLIMVLGAATILISRRRAESK